MPCSFLLLSSSSWYRTVACLSIQQQQDIWFVSSPGVLKLLETVMDGFLYEPKILFLLVSIFSGIVRYLTSWGAAKQLPRGTERFHVPTLHAWGFLLLCILASICCCHYFLLIYIRHSNRCGVSHYGWSLCFHVCVLDVVSKAGQGRSPFSGLKVNVAINWNCIFVYGKRQSFVKCIHFKIYPNLGYCVVVYL